MNANFMKNVPREALPNAEEMNSTDSVPWYMRYGARILGTLGGLLSIILGALSLIWGILTLTPPDLAAALIEVVGGILVTLLEAPFLCSFLSFAQKPGELLEKNRSPFIKAILYITIGVLPLMINLGMNTFFGSGLVLMTGVVHAVIGLGAKAPREQMAAAAMAQNGASNMEQGRPPVY